MKYEEITEKIIGAAMAVHRELGNGFQEVIYQRALTIEFKIYGLGVQKGDKYLVIYNEKNPKESCMLFEYPIKDSKDFERYIKELKNNPKKLNNYRKKNKNK